MARFGILGRLLLIFLSTLLIAIAASMAMLRWQDTHRTRAAPFAGIEAASVAADLLAQTPTASWPADLRALDDRPVLLRITSRQPSLEGLVHAPLLERRLRALATTRLGGSMLVYTSSAVVRGGPRDSGELVMALAVATLPDGRFLTVASAPAAVPQQDTGIPLAAWMGLVGVILAGLAVYGAVKETRPLRRLIRMVDRFEGAEVVDCGDVGSAPDVRALAKAIAAMQLRVTALLQERTVIVGGVSHDLRTLLTRLQLRVLTTTQGKTRQRLEADIETMRTLVDDALAYLGGTGAPPRQEALDRADIVATEIAEREAAGTRLPIEASIADAPSFGDPVSLRRAISNLLDNADKFGRSRVAVAVARDPVHVFVIVEDDGSGIAPEERTKVLRPFYRLEQSRNRQSGGVGLGLAIAQRIVAEHRGTLVLQASASGGARALLTLPAGSVRSPMTGRS